jgi:SAM-dependent methyltransferase
MQKNLVNGAALPGKLRALDRARIAKTWQQYYEERGYDLWGFSPSPTARILAQAILDSNPRRSERIEIVDWGCGYGRDSLYFLELGFDVIGIDVSEKAVALARSAYKQRQATGMPLSGSASFHAGDLHSVFKCRTGQRVRAFFSNRVLHLLDKIDFRKATREAMTCMEEGAYFCVSARSPDDFNTALMEWIPGKEQEMARYKDPARSGHDITFVTEDRLLRTVGNDLEDMHYAKAREPERVGSPDTHLLILLGRKRGWVSDTAVPTVVRAVMAPRCRQAPSAGARREPKLTTIAPSPRSTWDHARSLTIRRLGTLNAS